MIHTDSHSLLREEYSSVCFSETLTGSRFCFETSSCTRSGGSAKQRSCAQWSSAFWSSSRFWSGMRQVKHLIPTLNRSSQRIGFDPEILYQQWRCPHHSISHWNVLRLVLRFFFSSDFFVVGSKHKHDWEMESFSAKVKILMIHLLYMILRPRKLVPML